MQNDRLNHFDVHQHPDLNLGIQVFNS